MRNRRNGFIVAWILVLMLLAGCSAPSKPAVSAEPETTENTFGETEPEESVQTKEEDSAISLTKAALTETEWIAMEFGEGRIDMPANEAFLEALDLENWESVSDVADSVEVFRFAVGTGEIVINEGSAYLMTDHGMDWYLTSEEVVGNLMVYMEENFTMSARSMLFDDEYMFVEYYYDTIPTLGNLESFDGHGPLIWEMVKYAWNRYTYENAEGTVRELYSEESGDYIFPKAMALQEAKRYFDFDESATDFVGIDFYNEEKEGFEMWYSGPDMTDRSNFQNGWNFGFGGLKALGDDRYEVRLVDYVDSERTRSNKTNVMEISFDANGNLKFDRGYQEKQSYDLADAAPGLESVEILKEYEYMGGEFLGETEADYYFIADDGEWVSYFKLNKATMEMTTAYAPELPDEEYLDRVEQHGEEFFFYMMKQVWIADADWNLIETIVYPEAIVKGKQSQWNYGDELYFGETLSDDRSMFAYVDEEGLKIYTIATGKTELIKAKEGEGDVTEAIWCLNPRFADHDTKIVTARTRDYDSGFYLYDLETKEEKVVSDTIMPEPWVMAGDRGFFAADKTRAYFYEYQTGKMKDLPIENQGPHVYEEGFIICNGNYATYFDNRENGKDLVILNLDTWTIEKSAPIEGVDASIMFLSDTGDVGITYAFTYENYGAAILRNK